jgi:hypothetical protein
VVCEGGLLSHTYTHTNTHTHTQTHTHTNTNTRQEKHRRKQKWRKMAVLLTVSWCSYSAWQAIVSWFQVNARGGKELIFIAFFINMFEWSTFNQPSYTTQRFLLSLSLLIFIYCTFFLFLYVFFSLCLCIDIPRLQWYFSEKLYPYQTLVMYP